MKYLILHGSFGSPDEHWFPWLSENLKALGHEVLVPQMPVDDFDMAEKEVKQNGVFKAKNQILSKWFDTYESDIQPFLDDSKGTVVIAHSISPVFTLHLIERYKIEFDSVIFVAPFYQYFDLGGLFEVIMPDFTKDDFDFEMIRKLLPISYAVFSDNDPYVATKYSENFVKNVGSIPIQLKGGEHFNTMTEFPLILELCKGRHDYLKTN